jgi:hypothetical protein
MDHRRYTFEKKVMKKKLFLITAVLVSALASAQDNPSDETLSDGTLPVVSVSPSNDGTSSTPAREKIVDYKSVYETSTVEEEVKMATSRFELTKSQQDIWLEAATERRLTENKFRDQANVKGADNNKDAAYRELRTSQNTFYETVIGYLSPAQKQKLEVDRNILNEKQKKLAKIPPPPPPPTPTITAVPVDSAAIKESEKKKAAGKKSKKKKKAGN